ncbi:MAG TPA: D-2-hydroxyacid dehydrogenase [Bacteroidales bacterium]|nr:D-2-hydroxyacid dehydrogenase [Bacteroidales bacterium]
MKIVVLDGFTLHPGDLSWHQLEEIGNTVVHDRTGKDHKDIINAIGDAEIVFTNKTPINAEVLDACRQIKYIGILATGYDVVDIEECRKRTITVSNVPSYGTNSVAQHTIALLLEVCNHVWPHNRAVGQGEWKRRGDFSFHDYPLTELAGKTIGIIGFGNIGSKVADIARALEMNIIAYDPSKSGTGHPFAEFVSLDNLLTQSDIISLHCPLTENNKYLINKSTISKMKKNVIIINTSRGGLINEHDLREALDNNTVRGAAVDVVSKEPIEDDNPLLGSDKCIITPHIAWAPYESRKRLMNIAVENLKAFLNGKKLNVVS